MTIYYTYIPEDLLTPDILQQFNVVGSYSYDFILSESILFDRQGNEQRVKQKWITFRVCESFIPFDEVLLDEIRSVFNNKVAEDNQIPDSFPMHFEGNKDLLEWFHENNNGEQMENAELIYKVERDIAFGRKLKIQFLAEQKDKDLTLEQDLQIYQSFSTIISMLDIGAINRAQELWVSVPVDGELMTIERKQFYSDLLTQYLGV